MPRAIWVIGFAIFAQGTSELMIAGLLPELSSDLRVTIPEAALLVSTFALGMCLGAPTLGLLTLRLPRRTALLAFLAIFLLSHVAGALATNFWFLAATRLVSAFSYAGFWAVGGSVAMALAGPERRARAMSVLVGGLTVAMVLGVPAGTWIGQHGGWRDAFWLVALLCLAATAGVAAVIPEPQWANPPSVRAELRGMTAPRLWLSYLMTATSTASAVGTFAYLAAMLVSATGVDSEWVPGILSLYGVGAVSGITAGGRVADRHPRAVLFVGFVGLLVTSILLAQHVHQPASLIPLIFVLSLLGSGVKPALSSRFVVFAPMAPTLAVAGNICALNFGIMTGPWLGGMALTLGHGYSAVPAVGAAVACAAMAVWALDVAVETRERFRPSPRDSLTQDRRAEIG